MDHRVRRRRADAQKSRAELIAASAANGQRIYAVHFPFPGLGKFEKQGEGSLGWGIVRLDATLARWGDLEAVFSRGCSVARGCWCMAYRRSGTASFATNQKRVQANRGAARRRWSGPVVFLA